MSEGMIHFRSICDTSEKESEDSVTHRRKNPPKATHVTKGEPTEQAQQAAATALKAAVTAEKSADKARFLGFLSQRFRAAELIITSHQRL